MSRASPPPVLDGRSRRLLRLLLPNDRVGSIQEVTPEFLGARGLAGVLLDLDNTIVAHGRQDLPGWLAGWAARLREAGIGARLVSNALPERVRRLGDACGIQGVGVAGKPAPGAFRRACAELGLPPPRVAVVGDQLFTDVLGGNLAGAHTVLVPPLSEDALPHTRLARLAERLVLRSHHAGARTGRERAAPAARGTRR